MATIDDISQWKGEDVVDPGGDKVGRLEEIYYDVETDEPAFLAVKMGFLGHSLAFVPFDGAAVGKNYLVVRHAKSVVKNAPTIQAGAELPADEEAKIYDYYGMPYTSGTSPSGKRLVRR